MPHTLPVKIMCLHDFRVRPVNFVWDIKRLLNKKKLVIFTNLLLLLLFVNTDFTRCY